MRNSLGLASVMVLVLVEVLVSVVFVTNVNGLIFYILRSFRLNS